MNTVGPPFHTAPSWTSKEDDEQTQQDGPVALLRAVLATLWRHKFKLGLWILVCAGAAAAYAQTIPYSYTATATVLISPTRSGAETQAEALSGRLDMHLVESELELIRSERLLSTVFEQLRFEPSVERPPTLWTWISSGLESLLGGAEGGQGTSPEPAAEARQHAFEDFSRRIDVRRIGQSYVVAVSFTAPDPTLARLVTNALVSAYLWQSVAAKANLAETGGEVLQSRVNALSEQAALAFEAISRGELPAGSISDADARVIGAALQPLEPSAPRKKLITAFGTVLGMVSGFFVLAMAYAFDRKVRTPADVTRATNLPCLVMIPKAPKRRPWRGRARRGTVGSAALDNLGSPFSMAIRDLRTAIATGPSPNRAAGGQCVALVAFHPRAGCSFLCHNLADVFQKGGRPTTLIEADLQAKPFRSHESEPSGNLAEALVQAIPPDDIRFNDRQGVAFLPAASAHPETNYLADLSSPSMAQLIEHARAKGDVVLDLPSLSQSSDAKALARRADKVVLVALANRTTVDDLALSVQGLKEVGANVIGIVLNRV